MCPLSWSILYNSFFAVQHIRPIAVHDINIVLSCGNVFGMYDFMLFNLRYIFNRFFSQSRKRKNTLFYFFMYNNIHLLITYIPSFDVLHKLLVTKMLCYVYNKIINPARCINDNFMLCCALLISACAVTRLILNKRSLLQLNTKTVCLPTLFFCLLQARFMYCMKLSFTCIQNIKYYFKKLLSKHVLNLISRYLWLYNLF